VQPLQRRRRRHSGGAFWLGGLYTQLIILKDWSIETQEISATSI
jgi:hypothetical protein